MGRLFLYSTTSAAALTLNRKFYRTQTSNKEIHWVCCSEGFRFDSVMSSPKHVYLNFAQVFNTIGDGRSHPWFKNHLDGLRRGALERTNAGLSNADLLTLNYFIDRLDSRHLAPLLYIIDRNLVEKRKKLLPSMGPDPLSPEFVIAELMIDEFEVIELPPQVPVG